jgi:hypothetical protein
VDAVEVKGDAEAGGNELDSRQARSEADKLHGGVYERIYLDSWPPNLDAQVGQNAVEALND